MLQNPFIINGAIPDAYFCDRVEETDKLIRLLTHGSNVLLSAPRRIGKSKLIDHCFVQPAIADQYYTIYIDLFHTTSLTGFVKAFGVAVFDVVKRWDEKLLMRVMSAMRSLRPTMSFDELGKASWGVDWSRIAEPEMSLKDIFEALENADKPCIVAFDEFQQISEYPEKGTEALLRGFIQRMSNCHFIFSGSKRHLLTEIFTQQNRPFYDSVEPMSLLPIAEDKYTAFATQWMAKYKKTIAEGVVHQIYELGEGNTAFLQRTMHHAFDRIDEGDCCTPEVAQQAINDMLDAADEMYKEKMSFLSERQQDVLLAITKEKRATKVLSGGFIKKYGLPSSSAVQAAIKVLLAESWISESDGCYFVSDTIFRLWQERLMGNPIRL